MPRRNNNSLPSVAWWASAWNIVNVDRRSSAKPLQRENFLSREAQINLRQITFDIGGTGKGSTRLFATALRVWRERFRQFMGRIFNHAPSTKGKPYTLRGANIWKINICLCAERAVWLIHPIRNPKFWMRQRINYGNVNICSVKANKIDTRTIPCRVAALRSNIVQIIWELLLLCLRSNNHSLCFNNKASNDKLKSAGETAQIATQRLTAPCPWLPRNMSYDGALERLFC